MRHDTGDTALWDAARRCNVDELQQLVRRVDAPVRVNEPHAERGTTPLMVAATKKRGAATVRALLALGAAPNVTDSGAHHNTALHYAAYHNRTQPLELLLAAGADLFALNGRGHTALDVARLRGRREAAAALTARLELYSGWLRLRSKSLMGFWKRRWCVLIACNAKRSTAELCVFRSPTRVHPEAVLWQDSKSTQQYGVRPGDKAHDFHLDTRVAYQKLRCRRYSRYISSGRTYVHKANVQPREFVFACESAGSRAAWLRALENRQRESDCTNMTFSSSYMGSPPTSSSRSRGPVVSDGPLLLTAVGPAEDRSYQRLDTDSDGRTQGARPPPVQSFRDFDMGARASCNGARPAPVRDARSCGTTGHEGGCNGARSLLRPSAPRLIEEWGEVPAPRLSRTQRRTFPVARVVTISSDPNAPEPVVRGRCIVCFENCRDAVCIPCGHVAGCYDCTRAVTQESNSCPVCRAHVDGVVRIKE
ncbi:unnamed protein product [Hyaloperonospora brassicae]|uniref:RING-type domain-containing protein n=1 Tax=Hyaloperonospora brassicae TaxID=162125 RepID=A0AAV0T7I6_HYABA|nr:unnamed protein product [Hyaloperonospora brassicae]